MVIDVPSDQVRGHRQWEGEYELDGCVDVGERGGWVGMGVWK